MNTTNKYLFLTLLSGQLLLLSGNSHADTCKYKLTITNDTGIYIKVKNVINRFNVPGLDWQEETAQGETSVTIVGEDSMIGSRSKTFTVNTIGYSFACPKYLWKYDYSCGMTGNYTTQTTSLQVPAVQQAYNQSVTLTDCP